MQLFFEEDGNFKAGAVLKKDGNAYQVELPTGRRTKVKGGHVFFEYEGLCGADFMAQAQSLCEQLDPNFLWEVAPQEEFGYEELARDYFTQPKPVEKAAVLMALHTNPVFFYRKGKGGYKAAPEEILRRALEALEKRKRQEQRRQEMVTMMCDQQLPEEISRGALDLLLHPDKNSIEWKALNDASAQTRQTPLRLLLQLRAIKSPWRWHVDGFYAENFAQGRGFPGTLPAPVEYSEPLPLAQVTAFSIDDASTNEIDDAASVVHCGDGKSRIGVHIAAPALLIDRDSAIDKVARTRMSTVYAPGLKTTMLPDNWIQSTSLDAGRTVPCVSLYITVEDETMQVLSTETRVERICVADNLRYDNLVENITAESLTQGTLTIPYAHEIEFLWRFARARQADREEVRGRPEPVGRIDWYFDLEGEGEQAIIHLKGRARGEPIDLLVAELMIFANCTWGLWLEEHGVAGIYRSQRMGRVRMSTVPGPHDGLGVLRYAWSSSPLRRYVDLVNQRQIILAAQGRPTAYQANDADFFTIISQFEAIYENYNEFQRRMERYWSLRWIEQEGLTEVVAIVVKEDLVRIDGLPFMQRIPGLPELDRGRKVRLAILSCDLVDLFLETRLMEVLAESAEIDDDESQDGAVAETDPAPESEVAPEAPEAVAANPSDHPQ